MAMSEDRTSPEQTTEVARMVAMLKAEGWREQRAGTIHISGTIASSLMKDGEVITVEQDLWPDEELLAGQWGDE